MAEDNPYLKMYQEGMKSMPAETAPVQTVDPSMGEMAATTGKAIVQGATDLSKGLVKSAIGTAHGIGSMEHMAMPQSLRDTGYGKDFEAGLDTVGKWAQPSNAVQGAGKVGGDIGQFFVPGQAEEELATKLPSLGRFAKPVSKMIGGEAVNEAQGGPVGAGAAGAGIGEGMAAGMRTLAPKLARTAMHIPSKDFAFGKTPGEAILNDTKGILPETVGASARDTTARLSRATETAASNAPGTASLLPARQGLQDWLGRRETQQAPRLYDQINDMRTGLDTIPRGPNAGNAIPNDVPPSELLAIKRGFSDEHLGRWNPDTHEKATAAGRQAYGNMADEFHRAVPEAEENDQRVSSLIPVLRAADKLERSPDFLQRTAGRVAAHTGAMTTGIGGAMAGGHAYGLPGAIVGGGMGLLTPELLASPETQMMAARTMGSKGVQNSSAPLMSAGVSKLMSHLRRGDQ